MTGSLVDPTSVAGKMQWLALYDPDMLLTFVHIIDEMQAVDAERAGSRR